MASTWTRITDPVVRSAFREIVELLGASGLKIDLDRLDAKLYSAERSAAQAQEAAYQAIQAAADAQEAADGKIVSYFQPDPPQDASEGDLWFDTDDDNKIYRYTNGTWTEARDEGIPYAIQVAQNAQATADGKIVTYYQNDAPQNASEGDLWFDTDDDNKVYRYTGGAWIEVRDQGIQQALADAANAQATADGKIVSYYQPDPPTGQAVGDLWFDTDSDNRVYRWDGTAWVDARDSGIAQAINDAALAQATADSKIVTYYQPDPPTASAIGDLWVDTDDNNHLYRWNGTAWVSIRDGYIDEVGYTREKLEADLRAGVDLVFKDISTVDTTYPSALVVGNITLNPDGTVAYGSRGVAITKNGLAGFDDSYNGSGDLPSFEIDTLGNATFRGTVSGAEMKAVHGSFQQLESGDISSNGILLTSTDIDYYRGGNAFRAVKQVVTGVATNGSTVSLSGFYDRPPSIIVSINDVMTTSPTYTDYEQRMELGVSSLSGDPNSGEWTFKPTAILKIGDSSTIGNPFDKDYLTSDLDIYDASLTENDCSWGGGHWLYFKSQEYNISDSSKVTLSGRLKWQLVVKNLSTLQLVAIKGHWSISFKGYSASGDIVGETTIYTPYNASTSGNSLVIDDFSGTIETTGDPIVKVKILIGWWYYTPVTCFSTSGTFYTHWDFTAHNSTVNADIQTTGYTKLENTELLIYPSSSTVVDDSGTLNWIAIG